MLVRWKSRRQDTQSDFIRGNSLTAFLRNYSALLKIIFIQSPPPLYTRLSHALEIMSSPRQMNASSDSLESCFL